MTFDLQRARQETPGCEHVLHFNNAGASLMPQPVLDATISHLQLEAQIGGYEAEEQAHDAIEHVYDAAAALAGCSGDELPICKLPKRPAPASRLFLTMSTARSQSKPCVKPSTSV